MHDVRHLTRSLVVLAAVLGFTGFGAPAVLAQTSSKPSTSTQAKPPASTQAKPPAQTTRTSLARARAAERARQAALARQQQDAMTPRYKRDLLGNLVPDVRAAAAIIYSPQTGQVLWEANAHDQRSIASLTKVMTALVVVADDPDLRQRVVVTSADTRNASVTYLRAGEIVSYHDLLHLALIASDNAAARVLARTSEGGTAAFLARMNEMAQNLGLTSTRYADPSGLDARNVSSAYDVSQLISFAAADARLSEIMRKPDHRVRTSARTVDIRNTNQLLSAGLDVRSGKTGFISKAGYCLAALLRGPEGSQVAVVVLGATNSTIRFWEARHLFNWVVGGAQGLIGGEPDESDAAARRR